MLTEIIAFFQTVLYAVSVCLLPVVMLGLIVLLLWIVAELGSFCAEALRRRSVKFYHDIDQWLPEVRKSRRLPDNLFRRLPAELRDYFSQLETLQKSGSEEMIEERIEVLIQQREIRLHKRIEKPYLLVRIGPALGLMGTLIPMGQGLASLGQGNLAEMSSSLIIAFTTTVAGLGIGILAFLISTVRGRWMKEDILALELLTDALAGTGEKS